MRVRICARFPHVRRFWLAYRAKMCDLTLVNHIPRAAASPSPVCLHARDTRRRRGRDSGSGLGRRGAEALRRFFRLEARGVRPDPAPRRASANTPVLLEMSKEIGPFPSFAFPSRRGQLVARRRRATMPARPSGTGRQPGPWSGGTREMSFKLAVTGEANPVESLAGGSECLSPNNVLLLQP